MRVSGKPAESDLTTAGRDVTIKLHILRMEIGILPRTGYPKR